MKMGKRVLSIFLTFALIISCMMVPSVEAKAATKTTTYILDSKKGIYYPTKTRCEVGSKYEEFEVYLKNKGDYVSSVKATGGMIVKKTYSNTYSGSYPSAYYYGSGENDKFNYYNQSTITTYTAKPGTFTVTLTIKNSKTKKSYKKKVRVYGVQASYPVSYITYGGKKYYNSDNLVTRSSGKLKVKANPTYKIKKIQVGTYLDNGEISYKTVKNGSTIKTVANTKYVITEDEYNSDWYSYSTKEYTDNICGQTIIKVTYYDSKLGITSDYIMNLFRYQP